MTNTKTKLNMTDITTRLSVLPLNINGLSNNKKRKNLFEKIQNKNIDIVLLQETHSTKESNGKKNGMGSPFGILEKLQNPQELPFL